MKKKAARKKPTKKKATRKLVKKKPARAKVVKKQATKLEFKLHLLLFANILQR